MPRPHDLLGEDRRAFAYLLSQEALDNLPRVYSEPPEDAEHYCPTCHQQTAVPVGDALRAEVARLTGLLDEAQAELARKASTWDALAAEGRRQVERLTNGNDDLRRRLALLDDDLGRMRQERDDARRQLVEAQQTLDRIAGQPPLRVADLRADDERFAEELIAYLRRLGDEYGPLGVAIAAATLTDPGVLVASLTQDPAPPAQATPAGHALADDPRRPRLDAWPDDAVTLTYPELRRLVALHLDRYCEPGSGRAMREGDVPLRLSEVLDQ